MGGSAEGLNARSDALAASEAYLHRVVRMTSTISWISAEGRMAAFSSPMTP